VAAITKINRVLSVLKRMLILKAQLIQPKGDKVSHILLLEEKNIRKGLS